MRIAILALAATLAAPASGQAPPPAPAVKVAQCDRLADFVPAAAQSPNLQGVWDFVMDAGPRGSRGYLALGPVDGEWAGSLTAYATNSLAIRRLVQQGSSIRMVVASREGDVVFTAKLAGDGTIMCGTVAYHGGLVFSMIAWQRPASRTYPPQ